MKSSAFITESKEYKVNQVLDKLSDEDIVLALNSLTSNIKESALDKLKEIDDYLKTLSTEEKEALATLLVNNDFVLWYSALLHVIFGSVMGLMSGFLLHDRYRTVERIRSFW